MKTVPFAKSYAGREVLNLPALDWPDGKITAVLGANGSGKSTLARVLAGIEPADRNVHPQPGELRVGYLPQKSYAFRMSAERNIALNGSDAGKQARLTAALHLDALAKQRAKKLSGGETAKMALARLLMGRYDLLILDEPTAAMDMGSTIRAEELILRYREEHGCTLLLITHSLAQARRVADEVLFFRQGQLWEQGSAEQVLLNPQRAETKEFLDFYGV